MWLYLKALFMIKDPEIGKSMVSATAGFHQSKQLRVSRIWRRHSRRNKFKAHNNTQLIYKVK